MKTVCVIPARHGSQRLPGKPLLPIHGTPLIGWVVRAARMIPIFNSILVATDHEAIADAARAEGVDAVMTDPACPSGTDRIRQALHGREADIVVNIQGDEPAIPVDAVLGAHRALVADAGSDIATACVPIFEEAAFLAPHVVKVVRGGGDHALYFSRSPIPSPARREARAPDEPFGYKHLGLYVYRRAALERFVSLPPSRLERIEKLEQLRALEAGMRILCVESSGDSVGVDVAEDIPRAEAVLARQFGG